MASITLAYDDIVDILKQLRHCYALASPNWAGLEQVLIEIIKKSAVAELGYEPVREILNSVESAFDKDLWKDQYERIFRSCFVLIMMKRCPTLQLATVKELIEEFPAFAGLEAEELNLLLKFRNLMLCGIRLFNAKSNKGKLMDVAGRLSGKVYTTGGGSTIEAKRRETIYQELGGVVKKKLTVPRKRKLKEGESKDGARTPPLKASRTTHSKHERTAKRPRQHPTALACLPAVKPAPTSASTPVRTFSTLSIQDPDLLLLEPLPADTMEPPLSNTWFEIFDEAEAGREQKRGRFSPVYSPLPSGSQSPYSADGEWGLSLCSARLAPSSTSSNTISSSSSSSSSNTISSSSAASVDSWVPAAPPLVRTVSLTIDFSKPIFGDDDYLNFPFGGLPTY